jgi:hypothetical protein
MSNGEKGLILLILVVSLMALAAIGQFLCKLLQYWQNMTERPLYQGGEQDNIFQ